MTEPVESRSPAPAHFREQQPVGFRMSLIEVAMLLGRHRRVLLLAPIAAAIIAAVVTAFVPRTYLGVARILPPQQNQPSAAALLGQAAGGLAGLAGGALGMKSPSDLYIGILKSDTVANAMIDRFGLMERYEEKLREDARRTLAANARFSADKTGIITVEVEARDPQLAADLANGFVEELNTVTNKLAITEASQRRVFFERQLVQTKEKLSEAEVALRRAIDAGGIVSVDAQSRSTLETVARLRAQVSAKLVQIGGIRAYAAEGNPDLLRAERELAALKAELARLESGATVADPALSAADATPGHGVETIRLLREVKYHEVLLELVAKQYELARAEESRDSPTVQLLDKAAPPERRFKPKRTLLVAGAALAALLVAAVAIICRGAWSAQFSDPSARTRLEGLREAWGLSRRAGRGD
ncbi:MAG: Wzz/FepE/Etk N-terminal domain-containing protein [Anaeromyxobacter sp.]